MVDDGMRDINRAGWKFFGEVVSSFRRLRESIACQNISGRVDQHQLEEWRDDLIQTVQAGVRDLLELIDQLAISTQRGLDTASVVRRSALKVRVNMRTQLDDRSWPQK